MAAVLGSVLAWISAEEARASLATFDPGAGLVLHVCASQREAERLRERLHPEVLLTDGRAGLAWLRQVRSRDPHLFTIAWTGEDEWRDTVAAINAGVVDAVLLERLPQAHWQPLLQRGCEQALTRRHTASLLGEFAARNAELLAFKERLEAMVAERTAHLLEAQERLQAAQRLIIQAETQATVSYLLRGIAHEFNNPLAAIYGYAQRLRRQQAQDPDVVRRLDVILQEVEHCRQVVDQLRQLASPLNEPIGRVDPAAILQQASERLTSIGRRVPRLQIAALPQVQAAPRALETIFEHILLNAIEAGAESIECTAQEHDRRVRLCIANDGETPSDEVLANAVRPLFTTKAAAGHRGLGLTTAAALLREQDGAIELVRRTSGRGAAVLIELPSAAVDQQREERAATVPGPTEGEPRRSVLVVEDEVSVGELLCDLLRELGCTPMLAPQAASAMTLLAQHRFAALLVDLTLPDGSGIDVVRRALALDPGLARRIVLTSGDADAMRRQQLAIEHGFPILGKPFRVQEVQRLIHELGLVE
ncbi:MAG: response regulator [Planctomycetota bacterium]|nr:response regulator [Planctomycetota bacterium]